MYEDLTNRTICPIILNMLTSRSPELFTAPQGEALREARSEQIGALLSHDIHRRYDVTRGEFRRLVPDFLSQLPEYGRRLNVPLVVVPLSIRDFCKILHIPGWQIDEAVKLESAAPSSAILPPYTIWTHDGSRYAGVMPRTVSQLFESYEEASPVCEVFSLALQFPELFADFSILAPATYSDAGFWLRAFSGRRQFLIPYVNLESRSHQFEIGFSLDDRTHEMNGILSRGKQINKAS